MVFDVRAKKTRVAPYPGIPASISDEARQNFNKPEPNPFISHSKLLARARKSPPSSATSTVSSFTSWIYDLYVPDKDVGAMEGGQTNEKWFKDLRENPRKIGKIDECRKSMTQLSDWIVEYEDPLDKPNEFFPISALQLDDRSFVGRPDIVYRECGTNNILVVEHKCYQKRGDIPEYGWPNLKAQLWCYSLDDRWRDAPEIFVMGRVFDMASYEYAVQGYFLYNKRVSVNYAEYIFNTKVLNARDPRLHRECFQLFELFGGRCSIAPNTDAIDDVPF